MKLAAGIINSEVDNEQIYIAEYKSEVDFIQLLNEGDEDITINLFIQYDDFIVRIIEKDKVLTNEAPVKLDLGLSLEKLNAILISSNSKEPLSYIIQGHIISQPLEDILLDNLKAQLTEEFDLRYSATSETIITPEAPAYYELDDIAAIVEFNNEDFNNAYFNYNVSQLIFNGCNFSGVSKIKNTYGSVDYNSLKAVSL